MIFFSNKYYCKPSSKSIIVRKQKNICQDENSQISIIVGKISSIYMSR